jgi:hypothetical protein
MYSREALSCCKSILVATLDVANEAKILRDYLIRDHVITDEISYYQFTDDADLMKGLLGSLSTGLCTSVDGSRYGCGIVSDFDLYHNMSTDT